jgi:hypothetical protein
MAGLPTEPVQPSPTLSLPLASSQIPVWMPANKPIRCCSKNGALIGLGVGVGLAVWLVHYTCDAAECGSAYVGAMAFFGGIGAGIGTVVGTPNITQPRTFPVGKRVGVAPVVSRQATGGAVSVRF